MNDLLAIKQAKQGAENKKRAIGDGAVFGADFLDDAINSAEKGR